MTNLSGPNLSGENSSRGYMYGWMWWKPQEEFVSPPPPPSYDDAVANDRFVPFSSSQFPYKSAIWVVCTLCLIALSPDSESSDFECSFTHTRENFVLFLDKSGFRRFTVRSYNLAKPQNIH